MCVCILKTQNHEANEKVSELEQRPLRRETKIWLPGERPWNPEAAQRGQKGSHPRGPTGRVSAAVQRPCETATGAGAQRGRDAAPNRRGLGGKTARQWGKQSGSTATPSVAAVARARLAPSAQEAPPTRPALTSRRQSGDRPPGPFCRTGTANRNPAGSDASHASSRSGDHAWVGVRAAPGTLNGVQIGNDATRWRSGAVILRLQN